MDPNVAWQNVLYMCREEYYDSALVHSNNLQNWLDKGGFLPDNVDRWKVDMIHRMLDKIEHGTTVNIF